MITVNGRGLKTILSEINYTKINSNSNTCVKLLFYVQIHAETQGMLKIMPHKPQAIT